MTLDAPKIKATFEGKPLNPQLKGRGLIQESEGSVLLFFSSTGSKMSPKCYNMVPSRGGGGVPDAAASAWSSAGARWLAATGDRFS